MRPTAFLILASAVLALPGCQEPTRQVIGVLVDLAEPRTVADVRLLEVELTRADGKSETLTFPEGGLGQDALTFPTDLGIVTQGLDGTVTIEVTALTLNETLLPVGRGVASLELDGPGLYEVTTELGVSSTCGDGEPAPGNVPEVCFERDGTDLEIGADDALHGNIANGVEFVTAGSGEPLSLLVVWSQDNAVPEQVSGLSLFLGAYSPERGLTYAQADERPLADPAGSAAGNHRSNTEGTVADLVGKADDPVPDGLPDLIASSFEAKGVTVWPKGGASAGHYEREPRFIPLEGETGEVHAGDVIPDLPGDEVVISMRYISKLLVIGHQVEGELPSVVEASTIEARTGLRSFELVDLDADGDLDIASASAGYAEEDKPGEVAVHLNDGSGRFTSQVLGEPELGWRDVAVVDADGDDRADYIAAVNPWKGVLAVYEALPAGGFGAPVEHALALSDEPARGPLPAVNPDRLRVGDVDGDGIPDLIACGWEGAIHFVLMGADGTPKFPPIRLQAGAEAGQPAEDLQGCDVADSDGDGVVDRLALVDRKPNALRVLRNAR